MNWGRIAQEFSFTSVRSRGPGGQNVNKVSSSARLRWSVGESEGLSDDEKLRVFEKLEPYINKDGELVLRSDEFRDLERNKARCEEKLQTLLKKALHKPKPRKKTKPSKAQKQKRLESKHKRSEVKKARQKVRY